MGDLFQYFQKFYCYSYMQVCFPDESTVEIWIYSKNGQKNQPKKDHPNVRKHKKKTQGNGVVSDLCDGYWKIINC